MVDVVPVVPVPVVLIGVVVEVRVCARAGPALYSGRAVTKVAAKTVVFKIIVSSAGASPSTNCRRGCSKTTGGAVREGRLPLKQFRVRIRRFPRLHPASSTDRRDAGW